MTEPGALDIYKLAVEMADRLLARRATANGFFLTVHSALVAAIGFVRPGRGHLDRFGIVLAAVLGLVLAAAWLLLLRSYRLLSGAKFRVINELEETLPAKPYTREWELVRPRGQRVPLRRRYAELGIVERAVPIAFAALYVAAIVRYA